MQVSSLVLSLLGAWVGAGHGVTGAALGTLPGMLVFTLRFVSLALGVLDLRLAALGMTLRALAAPFLCMLVLALAIRLVLPTGLALQQPAVYCLAVGAPPALAYVLVFLRWPAAAVADEASRWRRRLLRHGAW
jgi:hypothetical protein